MKGNECMKVLEFPSQRLIIDEKSQGQEAVLSVNIKEIEAETEVLQQPSRGRPKLQRENKKRISLAVYPSDYNNLQKIAYVNRQSVSDIITKLMQKYVEANADKLEEYDRIMGK